MNDGEKDMTFIQVDRDHWKVVTKWFVIENDREKSIDKPFSLPWGSNGVLFLLSQESCNNSRHGLNNTRFIAW